MAFAETFSGFFAEFATTATLNGVTVGGIFDVETLDEGFGVVTQRASFLLDPTTNPVASVGYTFVHDGVTYSVRQVLREPPDGVLKRLILVRV